MSFTQGLSTLQWFAGVLKLVNAFGRPCFFADLFGIFFGLFCDCFGIDLGSFCNGFGIALDVLWACFRLFGP